MNVLREIGRAFAVVWGVMEPGYGVMDVVWIFEEDRFRFRAMPLAAGTFKAHEPVETIVYDAVLEAGEWRLAEPTAAEPIGSLQFRGH